MIFKIDLEKLIVEEQNNICLLFWLIHLFLLGHLELERSRLLKYFNYLEQFQISAIAHLMYHKPVKIYPLSCT